MKPELPHLATFVEAAEHNSFTAAARRLGLTQAAVSQRIGILEEELGQSLFERRRGRVLLSPAGKKLYPFAQKILALHGKARGEIAGFEAPPTGELALAASSVPGEQLLPEILARFRKTQPHIQVRVKVADTRAVLRLVEQGQADLGLTGGESDSTNLEFRRFAGDTLVLAVPAGHPWAGRRRVSFQQLREQPIILREPGSGSRACLENALTQAGHSLRDLHVVLEMGSTEAIKEGLQRGLGLAFLSSHALTQELNAGRLHVMQVTGLPLKRDMFAVWDRRRVLPIPARLFLDLLEV